MSVRGCLFTVLLLAACAPPVRAQSALTIDEAVQQAIDRNLTLLAERLNLTVADAAIATARLRPNPVLSGGANSLDWPGTGFNEVNGAGPQEYAVRVDVPFERGKKRELRTAVASTAKTVAEAQLADSIRRLRLDVTIAAVDVLEAKAKLKLAHENLDTLQRLVQLNERRLISGALPPLEVTRSRVAMLQYRGSVKTAELAVMQARLKIHALLGRQAADPLADIEDDLHLAPAKFAPSVGFAQAAALTTRPDVRALQGDEARSQYDLRLQVAQGKVDYT